MVIRNKKSTHTQEVDQDGWDNIVKAGWKDRFEIVEGGPSPASKAPTPAPPEIASFAKPIGRKQQPGDGEKKQEPASAQEQNNNQGTDDNKN